MEPMDTNDAQCVNTPAVRAASRASTSHAATARTESSTTDDDKHSSDFYNRLAKSAANRSPTGGERIGWGPPRGWGDKDVSQTCPTKTCPRTARPPWILWPFGVVKLERSTLLAEKRLPGEPFSCSSMWSPLVHRGSYGRLE